MYRQKVTTTTCVYMHLLCPVLEPEFYFICFQIEFRRMSCIRRHMVLVARAKSFCFSFHGQNQFSSRDHSVIVGVM